MKVGEILKEKNRPVVTIKPRTTVSTAAHRLKMERVGCLVVSEDGVHPDGIVAVRDIVYAMAEHSGETPRRDEFSFLQLPISEIMTRQVKTCRPESTLEKVMETMRRWHHLHIPVLDDEGKLCGIVSIDDVIDYGVREMKMEADILRTRLMART